MARPLAKLSINEQQLKRMTEEPQQHRFQLKRPRDAEDEEIDTDLDIDDVEDGRRTPTRLVPSGATGRTRPPSTPPPAPVPLRRSTTCAPATVTMMTHVGTLANTGSAAAASAAATFVNAVGGAIREQEESEDDEEEEEMPPPRPLYATPTYKRLCADMAFGELGLARNTLRGALKRCSEKLSAEENAKDELQRLLQSAMHDVAGAMEILERLRQPRPCSLPC